MEQDHKKIASILDIKVSSVPLSEGSKTNISGNATMAFKDKKTYCYSIFSDKFRIVEDGVSTFTSEIKSK